MRTQRKFWFPLALCIEHCFKHNSISSDLLNQWIHTHFYHIYCLYGVRRFTVPDSLHRRPKFSSACWSSGSLQRKLCVHVALLGTLLPLISSLGCSNLVWFSSPRYFSSKTGYLRPPSGSASFYSTGSQQEWFCPPGIFANIWRHFWLLQFGRGVLLASRGSRLGMLLNVLQCHRTAPHVKELSSPRSQWCQGWETLS